MGSCSIRFVKWCCRQDIWAAVKNKEYQDVNLDTWYLYAKRASCSAVNPLRFNLSLYRRFIFPRFWHITLDIGKFAYF